MITIVVNEVLAIPELNMNPINTIELNRFCNKIEHLTKHISFPKDDDNKVSNHRSSKICDWKIAVR